MILRTNLGREKIPIKSASELDKMREAGHLLRDVYLEVDEAVKAGVSTLEVNDVAHEAIVRRGAKPAFLGLYNFPKSVCASINTELVHGIPSESRVLKDGDIFSIDIGVLFRGWYSDRAFTYKIGNTSELASRLVQITEETFWVGAAAMKPNSKLGLARSLMQRHVEEAGFHVVKKYVGHGIGRKLHEPPQIPHYGKASEAPRLKPGMVLAVEPMVGATTEETEELADEWTVVMEDGGLSAHYENTIAITDKGPEILTLGAELAKEKLAWGKQLLEKYR